MIRRGRSFTPGKGGAARQAERVAVLPWQIVVVFAAAAAARAACATGADLWHGEILWLERPPAAPGGAPLFSVIVQAAASITHAEIVLRALPLLSSLAAVAAVLLLAWRAFGGHGCIEAGALAAVSPLLCTAGWAVHPATLEITAAGLWLASFLALLEQPDARAAAWHGAAALLALSLNVLTVLLVAAELVALLCFRAAAGPRLWLRWAGSLAPGLVLIAALLAFQAKVEDPAAAPEGAEAGLNAEDLGYLATELALGRLHPWLPPTPELAFFPGAAAAAEGRALVAAGGENGAQLGLLRSMQTMFFCWFAALWLLALLSVFRIRAWTLPAHLRGKPAPARNEEGGRIAAVLLVAAVAAAAAAYLWLIPPALAGPGLPERRLLFTGAPVLVLAGRGFAVFQWPVMRYGLLFLLCGVAMFFAIASRGAEDAFDGMAPAAGAVTEGWRRGDALAVEEEALRLPAHWYGGAGARAWTADGGTAARLWVIRRALAGGAAEAALDQLRERWGLAPPGDPAAGFRARHPGAHEEVVRRGGRLFVLLWTPARPRGAGEGPAESGR